MTTKTQQEQEFEREIKVLPAQLAGIAGQANDRPGLSETELLRQVYEATDLGVWELDLATGYIHLDERARTHYGFGTNDVTLVDVVARIHPDDVERFRPIITPTDPATEDRSVTEYRVIHPDGTVRWLRVQRRVYFKGEGPARHPIMRVGASEDITERKQVEEKLKRQNQRLEILREIDTAILAADSVKNIVGVALSHLYELIGCRRVSLALFDWKTNEFWIFDLRTRGETALPQGTRLPVALFPANIQTLLKNQPARVDDLSTLAAPSPVFLTLLKEGFRATCHLPIFAQDNLLGTFNMASEIPGFFDEEKIDLGREVSNQVAIAITQVRLVEQLRYQANILENVSDAIITTDVNFQVISWNHAAEALYGWTTAEVIGQPLMEIGPIKFLGTSRDQVWRQLFHQGAWKGEVLQCHKDGSPLYVLVSLSLLKDQTGQITGLVAVNHDITERKRAETAQAKLEAQLRQAQKMESIGRLASGVAHDFNNLLTVIQGHTSLLQVDMPAENPLYSDLEQIRRASERAAALTRQLLIFSRQQVMTLAVIDLNGLVVNLDKMLRRLIGEDINLTITLQPDLWPILADSGQIEQVIMNLVVNARDAMPTGGSLTIETSNIHLDDNFTATHPGTFSGRGVLLAITDTGCGMDAGTVAQIFEPFFTTKEPGKGTGLGLAMVYGIVKQCRGGITVYSEPGRGTTFKIYLPATETDDHPVMPEPQPAARRGNETILLVEDDGMVRTLVRRVLQTEGYRLLMAHRGAEAIALLEQHQGPIDLLLTDVVMPEMSGRELAGWLKRVRPKARVLFMSGYADDAVVRHGVLMAEVEFLSKPFQPGQLVTKVRQVLDR